MRLMINQQIADSMICGSSIYSTGGGLAYAVQKKLFKKLLLKKRRVFLVSMDELKNTDYICTAYSLGSAGNTDYDLTSQFRIGMEELKKYTQKGIAAVFAGETNLDAFVFQAAANMNLPVLDADGAGGRTVPEIQYDNFAIFGESTLPLVAVTPDNKAVILKKGHRLEEVEKFVRRLFLSSSSGLIAVLDHVAQVKKAKRMLTIGIFKRAIETGEFIKKHRNGQDTIDKLLMFIEAQKIIQGKVVKVDIRDDSKAGFMQGYYFVQDAMGKTAKVFVKNENLICWVNDRLFLTPPDCILSIDPVSLIGLHNSKLRKGQEVVLAAKKTTKIWRSAKGKSIFSPKTLGFNLPSVLLKP